MDTGVLLAVTYKYFLFFFPLKTPFPWAAVSILQILADLQFVCEKENYSHPSFLDEETQGIKMFNIDPGKDFGSPNSLFPVVTKA